VAQWQVTDLAARIDVENLRKDIDESLSHCVDPAVSAFGALGDTGCAGRVDEQREVVRLDRCHAPIELVIELQATASDDAGK
jgi:hypothetical protein